MKKTTIIAVLGLMLSATACTTEDPTPPGELVDAGAPTDRVGDAAQRLGSTEGGQEGDSGAEEADRAGAAENPVCETLFGGPQTLMDRVANSRGLIAGGDEVTPGRLEEFAKEIALLEDLAARAGEERAQAIETVGEPLTRALEAVESGEGEGEEDVILPQIDVSGSVTAQDELTASCEG